jgi:hypothetical protein
VVLPNLKLRAIDLEMFHDDLQVDLGGCLLLFFAW